MLINRLKSMIELDEEKQQRIQQEEAFAKQLGTSQQVGLPAKEERPKNPQQKKETVPSPVTGKDAKSKEQISQKDRTITALAGQLRKAGVQPDFAAAWKRSASAGGKCGKSGGKGGDRASSSDRKGCNVRVLLWAYFVKTAKTEKTEKYGGSQNRKKTKTQRQNRDSSQTQSKT